MPTPSKFTAETRKIILDTLAIGASRHTAAAHAGIGESTLRRWLDQGKDADPESRWAEFHRQVLQAEAQPNVKALMVLSREVEIEKNWHAAWKLVERREPGYAPPMPTMTQPAIGPVVFQLAFSDGVPSVPSWMQNVVDAEVIDESESPALGDGSSADATPA